MIIAGLHQFCDTYEEMTSSSFSVEDMLEYELSENLEDSAEIETPCYSPYEPYDIEG